MRISLIALATTCIACSSSATSPKESLTGTWNATGLVGASAQLVLTQTGDTVIGTATVTQEGANPVVLQVRGQAGLNEPTLCFPVPTHGICVVSFALQAGDVAGDTLFYQGQFTTSNTLQGDVQSTGGPLPFHNVDGEALQFAR